MALMTVIKARKPKQIAKVFSADDVGNLIKQVAAQLVEGEARVVEVNAAPDMKDLLQLVTARSDLVLMPGTICGAVQGDTIKVITERLLAHKLGVSVDNVPGGMVEIDGVKYAARVKRGVTPPKWVLLDADNPEGMPPSRWDGTSRHAWSTSSRLSWVSVPASALSCFRHHPVYTKPAHSRVKPVTLSSVCLTQKRLSCFVSSFRSKCSCTIYASHHRATAGWTVLSSVMNHEL
nr:hypothetical protein [Yoonia sp.]